MYTQIVVPPLSQTMDTVVLVEWLKKPGDAVVKGEPLFVVETDKANLEVEAPASGTLGQVTAAPGSEIKVRSVIGVILAEGEAEEGGSRTADDRRSAPSKAQETRTEEQEAARPGPIYTGPDAKPLPAERQSRVFASPRARHLALDVGVDLAGVRATGPQGMIVERDVRAAMRPAGQRQGPTAAESRPEEPGITPVARRFAEEHGLDWRALQGTGPRGQVTRDDVERAAVAVPAPLAGRAEPAEEGLLEVIPIAGVRALIADRMGRGHRETAEVTLTAEADATLLVQIRRQMAENGIEASYNDLLLQILARALREHPRLNAWLEGDSIKVWRRIDIGLAVDAERGLLAPVIRNVDRKGLAQLAAETKSLVERAREGRCTPEELRGSTFTLTNLGMFGIDAFTPIINLPECAILGVGRIKEQPAVVNGQVAIRPMVWLSLTFDHRLVDGGPAARFLQRVVQLLERPHLLIA
jgi:pyruvate dehydrogenase E2 component (dihydrolipoamide acetyltransferase)